QGLGLRLVILFLCWLACVLYVMRYAEQVRRDPTRSLVHDRTEELERHFLTGQDIGQVADFTTLHRIGLGSFALPFVVMVWGVLFNDWWMGEMSALCLGAAILIGLIARPGEERFVNAFLSGVRDIVGVALIVGLARGIVVVMDNGRITDTILHWAELAVAGLPEVMFINVIYWLEVMLSVFVPSSSDLAVLSIPILAPVAVLANMSRHLDDT